MIQPTTAIALINKNIVVLSVDFTTFEISNVWFAKNDPKSSLQLL